LLNSALCYDDLDGLVIALGLVTLWLIGLFIDYYNYIDWSVDGYANSLRGYCEEAFKPMLVVDSWPCWLFLIARIYL